jgi:flavin reductase (DIM6/NTAB) family NADH-FMN oxidoreductase RutF
MVYPMPALLVGAIVDGKPNFMTAAWGGIVNSDPPMTAIAIRPGRYTHKGVKQNMTFSVNIPSTDLAREADYCGITPGVKVDKTKACQFEVFYGKLKNAPMIEQCPINLECKVAHALELGSHTLFIGQIEETHVSDSCLTNGRLDISKVKPLTFIGDPVRQYHNFGDILGKAFQIGLELKTEG